MEAEWPSKILDLDDKNAIKSAEMKYEIIRAGRNLRAEYSIPQSGTPEFFFKPSTKAIGELVVREKNSVVEALNAKSIEVRGDELAENEMPSSITPGGIIYIKLEGFVDPKTEIDRLSKKLAKIDQDLMNINKKLSNESFITKAPAAVVEEQRSKREGLVVDQKKLVSIIRIFENQLKG